MFKQYKPEDYLFTDNNGSQYISTPATNWQFDLWSIMIPILLGMASVAVTLYVCFK